MDRLGKVATAFYPAFYPGFYSAGNSGVLNLDPDAAAYLANVEAADGQQLPVRWKQAVNAFVVEQKAAPSPNPGVSNWDAIKVGAFTIAASSLTGSLIPFKGSAPTNVNYVSGDYSRSLGISGKTGAYLNTNRLHNADPQDNFSQGVWVTNSAFVSGTYGLIGAGDTSENGASRIGVTSTNVTTRCRTPGPSTRAGSQLFSGMYGNSRNASGNFQFQYGLDTGSHGIASTAIAVGKNIWAHAINGSSGDPDPSRKYGAYWIGESVDLAALNDSFIKLMAVAATLDTDAAAYIAAVEAADGAPLEQVVKDAMSTFVTDVKVAATPNAGVSIYDAIKQSGLLAGPRTLAGALVSLAGVAPTNVNFVQADYIRSLGLKGNGTTKHLSVGRNNNADPQDNKHIAVFRTESEDRGTAQAKYALSNAASGNGRCILCSDNTTRYLATNSNTFVSVVDATATPGLWGSSRALSTAFVNRYAGANTTYTDNSVAPLAGVFQLFASGISTYRSDARISFYSIGEAVDLAALEAALTKYMNSISGIV